MYSLTPESFKGIPVLAHFFSRLGGTSPKPWDSLNCSFTHGDVAPRVKENRARICAQLGVNRKKLFTPQQVHGSSLLRITAESDPEIVMHTEADAVWTNDVGVAVGITTADCAPVLVTTQDGAAVMAIHAGWRGALRGVIAASIDGFCEELRVAPDSLKAAIGPCISVKAYEVGEEVVDEVRPLFDPQEVVDFSYTKPHLNLPLIVEKLLVRAGVTSVEHRDPCTFSNSGDYYSYRRDKDKTGRQMSVICRASTSSLN